MAYSPVPVDSRQVLYGIMEFFAIFFGRSNALGRLFPCGTYATTQRTEHQGFL